MSDKWYVESSHLFIPQFKETNLPKKKKVPGTVLQDLELTDEEDRSRNKQNAKIAGTAMCVVYFEIIEKRH